MVNQVSSNTIRLETELKWIKVLQSASRLGFNDNIYQEGNISTIPEFDVFFVFEIQKRKRRSYGKRQKGTVKSKICAAQKSGTSLNNLSSKLRERGRHAMLSLLCILPIPFLRILGTEANRFYDRNHQMYEAAFLTGCYTKHALRPFIDAEINHQRYFIKFPFINKGMDFIDLQSIIQDKSVTSSIPDYFQNSEPPIICYKNNKPIRKMTFNFISLYLILTSMLIHLIHEIVKILNLYTHQLVMLSLEI